VKIITSEKKPIKSWCNYPESGALEQAKDLANLPFLFKHVALMPDTHQGYGMPIGGVIACKDVIIPNAVGVDIGCGMAAVKTSLTDIPTEGIKKIMSLIRQAVPVGFKHHAGEQDARLMPRERYDGFNGGFVFCEYPIIYEEYRSALKQLGTLGGGNHFIEIQKGSDGYIWFMVHSGSRNLGYKVAKHYNEEAQMLCAKWHSNIPKPKGADGLAFLPLDTAEGRLYRRSMEYCLQFAKANRDLMIQRIKESFCSVLEVEFTEYINIHHNYATMENHYGANVMVHRKGATSAKKGELGIIPGSQGTSSYIVRGKGNLESFMSCSHGAGRQMSRKAARTGLDLDAEIALLDGKGVIHSIRNEKDLEEAPTAYKDIDIVMEEQQDLVDIVVKLEPLAVIKG